MTKAQYFEMCEALKSQPIDSEIPVEHDDLAVEVQEALNIYSKLKDEWDTMNGNYLGKSYVGLIDILNLMEVPKEDRRTVFDLIAIIDKCRSKAIAAKRPKNTK